MSSKIYRNNTPYELKEYFDSSINKIYMYHKHIEVEKCITVKKISIYTNAIFKQAVHK